MTSPITVYSKHGCIGCRATEKFLTNKGVDYNVVDITDDNTAREEVLKIIADNNLDNKMPIVVAGDKKWSGFRHDELTQVLLVNA